MMHAFLKQNAIFAYLLLMHGVRCDHTWVGMSLETSDVVPSMPGDHSESIHRSAAALAARGAAPSPETRRVQKNRHPYLIKKKQS